LKPLKPHHPPDTLGYHFLMCQVLFGDDSAATQFLADKAEQSRLGFDEGVITSEDQMVALLAALDSQSNHKE
jgi:hypothetical protein